jgi:signal transduction histidine kinase
LRIVEAGDHQRRRLERDLHDGAQQRLMAVMIRLRMLEEGTEDERIASQLEAIGNDAEAAVEELRSLAHGIYPPVLRSYGLADALRSLASTAPHRSRSPSPMRASDAAHRRSRRRPISARRRRSRTRSSTRAATYAST